VEGAAVTDEELDRARAAEAERVWMRQPVRILDSEFSSIALIAARLAREGWLPEDPLIQEARKLAANFGVPTSITMAALKRGIEIGEAKALTRDTKTVARS
jgi:hypothetical protein